jgi:dTDP-4-amino-4,6-dideoxygalactose transaminase
LKNKIEKFNYPLQSDSYNSQDINEGIKILLSGQLTMAKKTKEFEKYFNKKINTKYCLMVNSGSSANLLALFCAVNLKKKNRLKRGDECLVPAICWSTTLWPIIQVGLIPKIVDVNIDNFSLDLEIIKRNITKKTKAIMIVNVLGNCANLDEIRRYADEKEIILIEDNCESLGSVYKNKNLGTYGDFSSFSFYFSHQITSAEGGMIACKSKKDYEILKSLRAHGWDREISKKKENTFNFINQGFNFRPLEVSAAIGLSQLKRLNQMIKTRSYNRDKILNQLKESKGWDNQYDFFEPQKNLRPSWFGLPLLIKKRFIKKKRLFLELLKKNKVETRPIISGNFANQPAIKLHKIKINKKKLVNAQEIETRGFFIGLPAKKLDDTTVQKICKLLLKISSM